MMSHEPDIAGLLDFAELVDRGESPFFVGRGDVLARLARQAGLVLDHWKRNRDVAGRTVIITGCPGMGKSALLRRFSLGWCNRPEEPASPLAVSMGVDGLCDADGVVRAFHRATDTKSSVGRILGALGSDVAKRLKAERAMDALVEAYYHSRGRARPIVLLVDEVQNVDSRCMAALSMLHEGLMDLPVLPVFAGLNDSVEALRRCGISRLGDNARVNLQPLPREDAALAPRRFFERFRVAGDPVVEEEWTAALAGDSLGFPQHLHVGLKAAARVLAGNGGTPTASGLRAARTQGEAARTAYYRGRLSDDAKLHERTLVDLVRLTAESGRPARKPDLIACAHQSIGEQSLIGAGDAEYAGQFVDRLIHDGILQENAQGTGYVVPIPSMRTWILGEYARSIGYEAGPERG